MSNFIVPMTSLPSVGSLSSLQGQQNMQTNSVGTGSFEDLLQTALQNVGTTSEVSDGTMLDLAVGGSDDLHTGAIASVKSSVSVSFASNLTSAAIRAYNELMRMQI